MSARRCNRRDGKEIVMAAMVSMIHPRMVLHVDQFVSPWIIFLTEEDSLRKMLSPAWVHRAKNLIHGGKPAVADSVQTGGGTCCEKYNL
jgi:hypothetical protein